MASGRVIQANRIFLNGNQYRVTSLEEKESSILPEKQVWGDWTKQSDPYKSILVFNDWREGVGLWAIDTPEETKSPWWSQCQLRWKGHLFPPFEVTQTDDLGTPNTAKIAFIIASDIITSGTPIIFAAFGDTVYSHSSVDESWTLEVDTNATIYDALSLDLGGTTYLVVATSAGYTYSEDASSWITVTTNANQRYLASWDDKLWMIDRDGQLRYCTAIATEVADAKLRLSQGSVTDLFVAPDANGEPILYAATTTGLYAHDFANAKFVVTGLQLPENANNGLGCCVWRGNIYFPSNMAVYELDPRRGTIRNIGLDAREGLPARDRGIIAQLFPSLTDLLALVNCAATTQGRTAIYGWNGTGWEQKWRDPSGTAWNGDCLYVCSAYSSYRIWFAAGLGTVDNLRVPRYIKMPADRLPPEQIGTLFAYQTGIHRHHTPWFTAGQDNIDKIALKAKVDITIPTANDSFTLYFARDWDETTGTLAGAVTVGPVVGARPLEYSFPASGDAVGVGFRAIKFAFEVTPGVNTSQIDVRSLTLEYVPKLRLKRQWRAVLDLNDEINGQSPKAQRDNLATVLDSQTLVEFTYRDEAGFFVLVFQDKASVFTGKDERGTMGLLLVEP